MIFENLVFSDFAHSGTPICGQTASWIQKLDSEVENNPGVSSNFSRKPAFLRGGGVWNFPHVQIGPIELIFGPGRLHGFYCGREMPPAIISIFSMTNVILYVYDRYINYIYII